MPRTKTKTDATDSKRAAVRAVLADKGMEIKPREIQKELRERFGLEMSTNLISNYKSHERGKKGLPRSRAGRPRRGRPAANGPSPRRGAAGQVLVMDDLRTLRDMAGRLGPKGLRELVDVLVP
jgi:hypothetical protein